MEGDAAAACGACVDALRHLLSTLGALLGSPAGLQAAQDAVVSRSLPALAKGLKRLWFETPCSEGWDSKEQALWLSHVLLVTEGSRAGQLSFYGAGLLLSGALRGFAEASLDRELDEAWQGALETVQLLLCGRHWEELQRKPADMRCGGGSDPLLSADRLPQSVKRTLDLEGKQLTRAQAAGLGAAMLLPGVMTLSLGGIGAALLVKSACERARSGGAAGADGRWQALQSRCLEHAHRLLRRKACPIEVRYEPGAIGPPVVRVSLYDVDDALCVAPIGSIAASSTGGESTALLKADQRCWLRPAGHSESFRMRVYRPRALLDETLHDGVEVRRGDRLRVEASESGRAVRVFAEAARREAAGRTAAASSTQPPPECTPESESEQAPPPGK